MQRLIYKILSPEADAAMRAAGFLQPQGVDLADGYVHFSTAAQLGETLDKHYAGHDDLMILAVESDGCGAALRWEASRGGDLFPHLYARFDNRLVTARFSLNAARDGLERFLSEAKG